MLSPNRLAAAPLASSPLQQPAQRVLPTYDPNQHVPPPPPLATLTVTPKGVLHLHASLRQALGIVTTPERK